MNQNTKLIIDFDSTFTQVEALDELATIVLQGQSNQSKIEQQISDITNQAMLGAMPFDDALERRISLLQCNIFHIEKLVEVLKTKITPSFLRNKKWIIENADSIYIVSGGFNEFIIPVVADLGIHKKHVFANEFIIDNNKNIVSFDKLNLLAQPQGKVKLMNQLNLNGNLIAIGDGFTDFEMKLFNTVNSFYLFTENITRPNLISNADAVLTCFEDLLLKL